MQTYEHLKYAHLQIPLTQLHTKLILKAMQYYSDRIPTRSMLSFVQYVMRLVENEHAVDPKDEIELLTLALSLLAKKRLDGAGVNYEIH